MNDAVHVIATSSRDRQHAGAEALARRDVLYVPKPLNIEFAVGMIAGSLRGSPKSKTAMASRVLAAGEVLFQEGVRGEEVYVVRSGRLRIFKQHDGHSVELGIAEPGEMIGEMAFFGRTARAATVEAIEPSEVLELDLAGFRTYLQRQPVWLRVMIDSLIGHLRDTSQRVRPAVSTAPHAVGSDSLRASPAEPSGESV
jgi:hypothetical protein